MYGRSQVTISTPLKVFFLVCLIGSILVTLVGGYFVAEEAPPYPGEVVTTSGERLFGYEEILAGQSVFQSHGLMDVGSVWGHGTLRGPDFTAQTLHITVDAARDFLSRERYGVSYEELPVAEQAAVRALAIQEIKTNRYDPSADRLVLTPAQVHALDAVETYYDGLFERGGDEEEVPILPLTVQDTDDRRDLARFFFWTSWAAGTLRPGEDHTYTNNWPPDRAAGNDLSRDAVIWTSFSLVALIGLLALMIYLVHRWKFFVSDPKNYALAAALADHPISSSQRKSAKYFVVVAALFLLQVLMGGFLANSTVSPNNFYGITLISNFIPYAMAKTWHLQLAVFWIATAWVGSSLYAAPIIGGKEPRRQGLLVDILFTAVVVVALGSLIGEVLGMREELGSWWFWLGHQGWEFLELGRVWQILLFTGLVIWLLIVVRAIYHHFTNQTSRWSLPSFYAYSAVGVVVFYGFGLLYDNTTHITIADFWRWWVVHTWVEGMFEFFAAAAIAYVLVNVGLADEKGALRAAYLTAGLAIATGVIGVGHHYYWFGDPSIWLALGGVISAMEPVPILLLLAKVWHEYGSLERAGRDFPYRWPILFLTASVVWNVVGAGIFGFLITLPMINYFEHSTYLTVNHGHTALFGTYGMLSIGLALFALRGLVKKEKWSNNLLAVSFWGLNIGLTIMFLFTLLPVGILQLEDSFTNGLWHARSVAFYGRTIVQWFGHMRIFPDTVIIVLGVIPFLVFCLKAMLNLKPVGVADGEEFNLTPQPDAKRET